MFDFEVYVYHPSVKTQDFPEIKWDHTNPYIGKIVFKDEAAIGAFILNHDQEYAIAFKSDNIYIDTKFFQQR